MPQPFNSINHANSPQQQLKRNLRHRNTHSIHYKDEIPIITTPNTSLSDLDLQYATDSTTAAVIASRSQLDSIQNEPLSNLEFYGYLIIIVTWAMFVVSIGCIFNLWEWCLGNDNPLLQYIIDQTLVLDGDGMAVVDNYYIYSLFLSFVIIWIWCVISWISMKLFRHTKGSG